MKEITIKRVKDAILVLKHLMYVYPNETELIEEQIANLEQVIENIKFIVDESEE